LPDPTRLGGVSLQVSDLDRAAIYCTNVLGLRVLEQSRERVALGAAGSTDTLVELHHRPGARPVPRTGVLGLYHFAILLPTRADLGRFVAHVARQGVPFASADHLVSEAIYLWDPDGLGIEVYADRPRGQWQTRGRELVMATDPLDFHDLVAAAANEPWRGMPGGTVMGHIHLSVGDLDAARRFYHEALGFDVTVWSYPGALFLAAGGYHHHLGTNTWAGRARAAGDDDARLLSWTLVLPSVDRVTRIEQRLTRAGYETATANATWQVIDPWRTTLRLAVG
jgi:catechol 2,3-dioxygenase